MKVGSESANPSTIYDGPPPLAGEARMLLQIRRMNYGTI